MSNRITFQATIFLDHQKGKWDEEKSYGFRAYDNESQWYENQWEEIPEDNLDCLKKIINNPNPRDGVVEQFLSYMREHREGCYINKVWHEWDQIKHLFV